MVSRLLGAALLLALVATGCTPAPPDISPEGLPATASPAVVEWRSPVKVLAIDNIQSAGLVGFGGNIANLSAGRHVIRYEAIYGGSVIYCGAFHGDAGYLTAVLQAGHQYLIDSDKITRTCTIYVWLEDRTTGELVAGRVSPARRDDLIEMSLQAQDATDFADLRMAAEAGDPDAAYALAMHYLLGDPPLLAPNQVTASYWLERAAEAGHTRAASLLGRLKVP
jgi:hypothetical protein